MGEIRNTTHLVEQACQGDSAAFGKLADEHYPTVYGVAFSTIGNCSGAEDIAQETFLLAWSRKGALRNAAAFPAWLRRIAGNLAKNWIRSAEYRRRLADHYRTLSQPETGPQSLPGTRLDRETRKAEVWRALETLSPATREAIVLYYLRGETLRGAAESLGISENAAKKRLQHGRAKLRAHFEGEWKHEMAQARRAMGTQPARDRFLAALVAGPAVPELAKSATAAGLGLWWEVTKQTALAQNALAGVGAMAAKKLVVAGTAVLLIAGGTYWAATQHSRAHEPAPARVAAPAPEPAASEPPAPRPSNAETPKPAVAKATPSEPAQPSKPAILPIEIDDPKDYIALTGFVVDASNVPVAGADVSVAALGLPKPAAGADNDLIVAHQQAYKKYLARRDHYWTGITDENGAFTIGKIRYAGATLLTARAPGYTAAMKYLALDDSTVSHDNIILQLQPGATIFGLLLGPSGTPVKDGAIKLEGFVAESGSMGGMIGLATFTNDLGQFELDVEGAGILSVSVDSETYGATSFSSVAASPDDELVLRYPPETSVFGTVTDSEGGRIPGVEVRLEGSLVTSFGNVGGRSGGSSSSRGRTYSAMTDSSGSYRVAAIDPGQRYTAEVVGSDGAQLAQGRGIENLDPGKDFELNFTVQPQMVVRGTIYGASTGKPLGGIAVMALTEDTFDGSGGRSGPMKTPTTSSNPDGAYAITLTGDGGTFSLLTSYNQGAFGWGGSELPDMPKVTLEPGETVTLDLHVAEPVTRSFRLVDDSGSPVEGATITIQTRHNRGTTGVGVQATTDAEGNVTLESLSPEGEVTVVFVKTGYIKATSVPLSATPGETIPEETVVMYRAVEASFGVVGPDGTPYAHQEVKLVATYGADGRIADTLHTDAYGASVIPSGLPATDVSLRIFVEAGPDGASPELSSEERVFSMIAGSPSDLGELRLAPVRN